jgi:hypothetical protein
METSFTKYINNLTLSIFTSRKIEAAAVSLC